MMMNMNISFGMGGNPYGGGYAPNPYQQPMGGGYTYCNSAYNVNQAPPGYGGYPGMQQQMPMMPMGQMMQQAPPSQQTNIVYNMMFNTDNSFSQSAADCLGDEAFDEEEEEEEEEEEDEEELDDDCKQERKKMKKKAKKRAKLQQKVAEKCKEDGDFLERVRQSYIARLRDHLTKDGTIDPTEGTVKRYDIFKDDDPVVAYIRDYDGTELAGEKWDPEMDVMYLKEACDGCGTNEDAIIYVCSTRNNDQRQTLKKMYKTAYGEDLMETLDSETSFKFKEVLMALFYPPAMYDAICLKRAIQGLGTDESVLIEILMSRTNAQIEEIKRVYPEINPDDCATDKDLECNIEDDTSGDLKRILISAAQGGRAELSPDKLDDAVEPVMYHDEETDEDVPIGSFTINMEKLINMEKAKREANTLFEAGEDCFGTDEETFIRIFACRETYQLRATYDEYVKLTQRDLENSIEREFSCNAERSLLTLIQCIKCRPKYFAERMTWSMEGLGTHDSDLIRLIVSRSEIDMVQIKQIFCEKNKQTLWNWIDQDCSGDYKKMLQAIVGKN